MFWATNIAQVVRADPGLRWDWIWRFDTRLTFEPCDISDDWRGLHSAINKAATLPSPF